MNFIKEFYQTLSKNDVNWNVKGLVTTDDMLLTLGSDSKIIGRIFELIAHPLLIQIGAKYGYRLEPSQSQTVYPDYTYINDTTGDKIAVDIKTTYRRYKKNGDLKDIGFTLGAFGSFIRNGTKNIAYPFDEYSKHYVLGFIYDRNEDATEGLHTPIDDSDFVVCPYTNVTVFAQEKHRIAGDTPGSGNTENIGTFKTNNVEDFILGRGPFSVLGEDVFLDYWKNYPRHKDKYKHYKSLQDYLDWEDNTRSDIDRLQNIYDEWREN